MGPGWRRYWWFRWLNPPCVFRSRLSLFHILSYRLSGFIYCWLWKNQQSMCQWIWKLVGGLLSLRTLYSWSCQMHLKFAICSLSGQLSNGWLLVFSSFSRFTFHYIFLHVAKCYRVCSVFWLLITKSPSFIQPTSSTKKTRMVLQPCFIFRKYIPVSIKFIVFV